MRTFTSPGAYNPLASDFDKLRLKILKQKKMAGRSSWAQNVAFATTEVRPHRDFSWHIPYLSFVVSLSSHLCRSLASTTTTT